MHREVESLCYTPESNATLYVNYMQTKQKNSGSSISINDCAANPQVTIPLGLNFFPLKKKKV